MNTQQLIQTLQEKGCDMQGAMERFLNDETFYGECYQQALEDENFEKLKQALEEKNITEAFNYAHTLKGVMANMGLTPLFDLIVKIVEPLRAQQCEDHLKDICEELLRERKIYQNLLN